MSSIRVRREIGTSGSVRPRVVDDLPFVAFTRAGFTEVLTYTASDNARSQAVMQRLNLRRDPSRDFTWPYDGKIWHGLVWIAAASDTSLTAR